MVDCDVNDFGLYLKKSYTRGQGIRLQQRMARTSTASQLFAVQAPSAWNKLPFNVNESASLSQFKCLLKKRNREL